MASAKEAKKIKYSDPKKVVEDSEGWKPTAFKIPDGVQLFKFKSEKLHKLDIIPYTVGEGNPFVDEGYVHYERTYYVHADVGPDGGKYCCPAKNFNKPCPICEHAAKLRRQGADKDLLQDLKPKRRQLWLVIDRDDKEAGVQLFEAAFYGKGQGFGEMLNNKLDAANEDSAVTRFFHLDDGQTLVVKTKKDSFNGTTFYKPTNMEMVDRKPLNADLLNEAPCLDELPIEVEYDKLKQLFFGEPSDTDDDDEPTTAKNGAATSKPKAPNKKPAAKDPDDDDEVDDDTGTAAQDDDDAPDPSAEDMGIEVGTKVKYKGTSHEVIHVSTDGSSLRLKDKGGKIVRGVAPRECTVIKADKPKPSGKKPVDDDDADDDAPPPKPGKKPTGKPSGKKPTPKDDDDDVPEPSDTDDDDLPFDDDDD